MAEFKFLKLETETTSCKRFEIVVFLLQLVLEPQQQLFKSLN